MTTTITTYTKGGLGCCLTFIRDGQAFAIHGRNYHDVDKLEFIGEPVKTSNYPPTFQCSATLASLEGLGELVEHDDPIKVLRAVLDREAEALSKSYEYTDRHGNVLPHGYHGPGPHGRNGYVQPWPPSAEGPFAFLTP